MKRILIFTLGLVVAVGFVQAQDLTKNISYSCKEKTLAHVLSEFSNLYYVKFSYSPNRIPLDKTISIDVRNVSVNEALEKILREADVEFRLSGDQVVLREARNADEPVLLKGKVIDNSTKLALPFASVRLEGTALGTATNGEGEFVLNIPPDQNAGSVIISYVGYRNYHTSWRDALSQSLFALEEDVAQLSPVTVTASTGLSVLTEAIQRIHVNYDTGSVLYTYFVRDVAFNGDVPAGASEAVYKAYRGPVKASSIKQIRALQGRRIKDFAFIQRILQTFPRWTGFEVGIDQSTIFLADLHADNSAEKFPGPTFMKSHEFELLGTSILDGREVFVISFDQKDAYKNKSFYKGKFYIDTESLAFLRIESELSPKGLKQAKFFGTSKAVALLFGYSQCEILGERSIINYREWNGKWYPGSMEIFWSAALVKTKSDFTSELNLKGNIVVTDIQTGALKPFANDEVLTAKDARNWEYLYKLNFWGRHNAIPADEDLENAFQTVAKNNRQHGIDMNFWRRYQPYKNNRELLVRDSLLCLQPDLLLDEKFMTPFHLEERSEERLYAPQYPALNRTFRTKQFVFHFLASDSIHASAMSSVLEENYLRVLGCFGISNVAEPVHVEIYPDTESYHFAIGNLDAPDSDVGMAVDNNRFKIVSPGNPGAYHTRESILKAAVHEFAHCVHYQFLDQLDAQDHRKIGNGKETFWLFEAMASYAAQQFCHPGKFEYLRKGQYPSLETLNQVEENGKVYDLGFVLIKFIELTWGKGKIIDLLRSNGDIETVLGISEFEFESKFYAYIKASYLEDGN